MQGTLGVNKDMNHKLYQNVISCLSCGRFLAFCNVSEKDQFICNNCKIYMTRRIRKLYDGADT